MTDEIREAFDYWRSTPALRAAICVIMREWGSLNPAHAESDDEAIDAYLADEDGRDEIEGFETIAKEILEAATTSAEAKYQDALREATVALDAAPIIRLDDTIDSARAKYSKWYREDRWNALALAAPYRKLMGGV